MDRYKKGSRPTPEEKHPGISVNPKTGEQFDPRTGTTIPKGLGVGKHAAEVRCGVCGRAAVLFGCSSYPDCVYTRTLDEGLAMHKAARGGRP